MRKWHPIFLLLLIPGLFILSSWWTGFLVNIITMWIKPEVEFWGFWRQFGMGFVINALLGIIASAFRRG